MSPPAALGENRVRIKGRKQSVIRFLVISNGFTIVWIILLSQMAYYSKLYGPQVLLQMNIAYFVPSIPVLVLFGHVENLLNAQLGPTMSMLARITFGMLGCALLCAWFPFIPQHVFNLLAIVAALGCFSAIAFSTSYQLVSWFRSADTIALGIGCVASGPVALFIQICLQIGPRPKPWQWIAMFEIAAGLVVVGLLAALSIMYQYWNILSGHATPEHQPLLEDADQDGDHVEVMADDLLLAAAIIHPAASGQNYVWSTPGTIASYMVPRVEYQIKSGAALRRAASAESDLAFADWRRPVVHPGSLTVPRRAQTAARSQLTRIVAAAAAASSSNGSLVSLGASGGTSLGQQQPAGPSSPHGTGDMGATPSHSYSSVIFPTTCAAIPVATSPSAARRRSLEAQAHMAAAAQAAAAAAAAAAPPNSVVVASPRGLLVAPAPGVLAPQSAPESIAMLEPTLSDSDAEGVHGCAAAEEAYCSSSQGGAEAAGDEGGRGQGHKPTTKTQQQQQQQQQQELIHEQGSASSSPSKNPERKQPQQQQQQQHRLAGVSQGPAATSPSSSRAGSPGPDGSTSPFANTHHVAVGGTASGVTGASSKRQQLFAGPGSSKAAAAGTKAGGATAHSSTAGCSSPKPGSPQPPDSATAAAAAAAAGGGAAEESLAAVTWEVFKQIWTAVLAALLAGTLQNWVFPFFTYVPSSGMFGEVLPQVLFYTRMMADITGRMLPRRKSLAITQPSSLFGCALLLLGLGGLFFAYLQAPPRLQYDPVPLLLVVVLWVGGGYVNTMSYILAPSLVDSSRSTKASALMALVHQTSHILGLALAIGLALALYGDISGDL